MPARKPPGTIVACRVCGAPAAAPCDHNRWGLLTKADAAAKAIRFTARGLVDMKTLSTGEKHGEN